MVCASLVSSSSEHKPNREHMSAWGGRGSGSTGSRSNRVKLPLLCCHVRHVHGMTERNEAKEQLRSLQLLCSNVYTNDVFKECGVY